MEQNNNARPTISRAGKKKPTKAGALAGEIYGADIVNPIERLFITLRRSDNHQNREQKQGDY